MVLLEMHTTVLGDFSQCQNFEFSYVSAVANEKHYSNVFRCVG